MPRAYMAERNIVGQSAEQRYSLPDEHGDSGERETVNETGAEKALDCEASVDVRMASARFCYFGNNLSRRPGHLLEYSSFGEREIEGTATKDNYPLVPVRPRIHGQNRFVCFAADDDDVYACNEFIVAVRLSATGWQEVQVAIWPCDEPVDTGADKDRDDHKHSSKT